MAILNLTLAALLLILLIPLIQERAHPQNKKQGTEDLWLLTRGGILVAMMSVSGFGILNRKKRARPITLGLGGVLLIQGGIYALLNEWGAVLFCFAYAAWIAFLMLPSSSVSYFTSGPSKIDNRR